MDSLVIKQEQITVNAIQAPPIEIRQEQIVLEFEVAIPDISGGIMRVQQFSFTATQGQTEFILPSLYKVSGMAVVAINGTTQNQDDGDFTITGAILELNTGIDAGDKVFGIYEVQI